MKTGLFGGTFNPVHCGHVRTAEEILAEFSLDRILFVPARIPVHKEYDGSVTADDRLQMLQLALAGREGLLVSEVELQREGPSYSILTLRALKEEYPDDEFSFILGIDSFNSLLTWFKSEEFVQETAFIVLKRPGCEIAEDVAGRIPRWQLADNRQYEISSTAIRQKLGLREKVDHLIDPAVLDYIRRRGLYEN